MKEVLRFTQDDDGWLRFLGEPRVSAVNFYE
jgi:hypothetical protein